MLYRHQKGFTLIELLASVCILALLLSFTMTGFVSNLRSNLDTQIHYESIQAAQSVLDDLRFQDISTLSGQLLSTVNIGNRFYTVSATYCEKPEFCISDEIRHISIRVGYNGKTVYETDTVYTKL